MTAQTHVILPVIRKWIEHAKTGKVSIFNFPPMRRPAQDQIRKLEKGSICLLFLYDDRLLIGEFKVRDVRRVSHQEFQAFKKDAFETHEARFPKTNEWCWIIEFNDFRIFKKVLTEDEIRKILYEVYGKSASMRPLHFTQVVDVQLINMIKTIMLVLEFTRKKSRTKY